MEVIDDVKEEEAERRRACVMTTTRINPNSDKLRQRLAE